ncbi:chromate efflux transporter [Rhizobium sp. C4]|uniref:chromate efflux transporter n=1 Tax=Rhizobium sp. C4 TaxID=1349800 RepID=UPI001E3D9214|nr:chromate efflux transporter [Rhizobium sp. C4]MCD2173189.1 chromate efflux transporter [Rhizobium sp. C4]
MTVRDSASARAGEVFTTFLKLGLTSFGGPIAHLGYFRDELVLRRRWIDEARYGEIVALCQFLPGPASSQVGFCLGLLRGGPLGALAAWTAFTLPSALLLILFAYGAASFGGPVEAGILHGLKLVAVAVVAQAVYGMAKSLTPDRTRAGIALVAVLIVTFMASAVGQVAAIAVGAVAGLILCQQAGAGQVGHLTVPISRQFGMGCLVAFFALLILLPLWASMSGSGNVVLFDAFYRSGALVFGGGHVVLPLLKAEIVDKGWLSNDVFLAGYGAAQAVPGPLFTFAAYLGAAIGQATGDLSSAAVALVAIFLPGLLLVTGVLPFWEILRKRQDAQAAMRGANAAVVGILGAALYNPVWTSAVLSPADFAFALAGFLGLTMWKLPPWVVVIALPLAVLGIGLI